MSELVRIILLVVSAVFPVVNPLGNCPFFLNLTANYAASSRRALAWRIAINSFLLLIGSYFIGSHILTFFGISLPVVQVGGGLIVVSTGWSMLNQRDQDDDRHEMKKARYQPDAFRQAFYPMTLPLTVGPGSISVAITLGANAPRGGIVISIAAALIASALIAMSIYVCYGFSDRLAKLLGPNAMSVVTRLSSFLLVCIGVQILWNGVKALLTAASIAASH